MCVMHCLLSVSLSHSISLSLSFFFVRLCTGLPGLVLSTTHMFTQCHINAIIQCDLCGNIDNFHISLKMNCCRQTTKHILANSRVWSFPKFGVFAFNVRTIDRTNKQAIACHNYMTDTNSIDGICLVHNNKCWH